MNFPINIQDNAINSWEEELESNIETIHFFNHEMIQQYIIKELSIYIHEYCKKELKFGIERILGFANKKNGDESTVSDYQYACIFCYSVYSKINVINRIKFIMELFNTSRINVINMIAGHLYMRIDKKDEYDWYLEKYCFVNMHIEEYFYNKYGAFIPYKKK